ncbi:hypothetical protein RSAG8_08367, partial [Rhizoctonia solani AG-8 WAC10335]
MVGVFKQCIRSTGRNECLD